MIRQNSMFDAFIETAREWTLELENNFLILEKFPQNADLIHGIFRTVHNLKGTSGIFRLDYLSAFAHSLEEVLDLVRQGYLSMDEGLADIFFEAVDLIGEMIEAASSQGRFDAAKCAAWVKKLENSIIEL